MKLPLEVGAARQDQKWMAAIDRGKMSISKPEKEKKKGLSQKDEEDSA